jgi:hypothetical protein
VGNAGVKCLDLTGESVGAWLGVGLTMGGPTVLLDGACMERGVPSSFFGKRATAHAWVSNHPTTYSTVDLIRHRHHSMLHPAERATLVLTKQRISDSNDMNFARTYWCFPRNETAAHVSRCLLLPTSIRC